MSRRRPPGKLRAALLWLTFAVALALAALQWLLPWLAWRGDLNAYFEELLRSSLAVPVRIERIETEPLSSLRITRLHSVAAEAQARLRFEARAITFSYDPLELMSGHLREVRFDDPRLFLDLDAGLAGLARMPEPPAAATASPPTAGAPATMGDDLLPLTVGSLAIERGELSLRFLGNELPLRNLRLEVTRLGKASGQRFHLAVEGLGGSLRAWGGVDVLREAGRPDRYAFREARLVVDDVEAAALLSWLTGASGVASWLPAITVAGGGKLQLEGSFEGTYPEQVEISLATHALDVAGAHGVGYAFSGATIGVHLCATVLGDLESAQFTVSTHAAGQLEGGDEPKAEQVSLEIAGEFRRVAAPGGTGGTGGASTSTGTSTGASTGTSTSSGASASGGTSGAGALTVGPCVARIEGLGELRFSGGVAPLGGEEPAELRRGASVGVLEIAGLLGRLPKAARDGLARAAGITGASGQARLEAQLGGELARPRCRIALEAPRAAVELAGGRKLTASLKAEATGLTIEMEERSASLERCEVLLDEVPAAQVAALLVPAMQAANARGTVRLALTTSDVRLPRDLNVLPIAAALEWRDLAFTPADLRLGWTGATGLLSAQLSPRRAARQAAFSLRGESSVREALAGPVYVDLEGESLRWEAAGGVTWDERGTSFALRLDDMEVETPVTGPVTVRGTLAIPGESGPVAFELEVEAPRIPGARAFRALVAEPLASSSSILGEGALAGGAALSASVEGTIERPQIRGRLEVGPAEFTSGSLAIEDLEAAIPFAWRPGAPDASSPPQEGFLRARRVHAHGASLGATHLQLALDGDRYHVEPLVVPLHGGQVSLTHACLRLLGPGAPEGSVHVHGSGLDTRDIAMAHDLPEIPGTLSFAWDPLRLEGTRLESHGWLRWRALGGEIGFSDLTVDNLTRPYAGLRLAEGRVRELDLGALGATFHFGVASGILGGTVRDLEITAGELTRFRLDVETVRRHGVPQYLNRAAIESIRRVLAGPLGALEETLFSKFFFRDFGFTAELDGETFRLRGKYRDGDREYILRGRWFELPRIDIVNARPGKDYEWRQIVENLRAVYEGR